MKYTLVLEKVKLLVGTVDVFLYLAVQKCIGNLSHLIVTYYFCSVFFTIAFMSGFLGTGGAYFATGLINPFWA